jgi:hypothetical protein
VNEKVEGRLVKICFAFDANPDHPGGFSGPTILTDLSENPIKLAAKDGSTLSWTESVGNLAFTGTDFRSDDFAIAEDQSRFSIMFDVPSGKSIEDYALSIGDQSIPLVLMESADYQTS